MTVKIQNIDISEYVTNCDLRHSCRGESTSYSLNGTAYTDRFGDFKISGSIAFGIIPAAKRTSVFAILKSSSFTLEVNGDSYTVHAKGDISAPYAFTDVKLGDCYKDVSVEVEEI